MEIRTDNYNSETSWTVTNVETGAVVASGGSYPSRNSVYSTAFPANEECLADGEYVFQINDVYGDGNCCRYGQGYFKLMVDGVVRGQGGSFSSTHSVSFTVPPPSDDAEKVELNLSTDNYGGETTWSIRDCSGALVASAGARYVNNQQGYIETTRVPQGGTFTINDSYGDGICCSYGQGSYTLSYEGQVVKTGGNFGRSETVSFGKCGAGSVEAAAAADSSESLEKGLETVNNKGERMSERQKAREVARGRTGLVQKMGPDKQCRANSDCSRRCKGDGRCV